MPARGKIRRVVEAFRRRGRPARHRLSPGSRRARRRSSTPRSRPSGRAVPYPTSPRTIFATEAMTGVCRSARRGRRPRFPRLPAPTCCVDDDPVGRADGASTGAGNGPRRLPRHGDGRQLLACLPNNMGTAMTERRHACAGRGTRARRQRALQHLRNQGWRLRCARRQETQVCKESSRPLGRADLARCANCRRAGDRIRARFFCAMNSGKKPRRMDRVVKGRDRRLAPLKNTAGVLKIRISTRAAWC